MRSRTCIILALLALSSCAESAPPQDSTPGPIISASPEPTASASSNEERHPPFVPRTYVEGDSEVLPLTFPDGTEAELVYPLSLGLGQLRVAPNIVEIKRSGCGSDPIITSFHPVG